MVVKFVTDEEMDATLLYLNELVEIKLSEIASIQNLIAQISSKRFAYRSVTIEELNVSARTKTALARANLLTLGDIEKCDLERLTRVGGLGKTSFTELMSAAEHYGIVLAEKK